MKRDILIVPAKVQDAGVLADIMISAWRSAFRNILPDAVIEQYTQHDGCESMFAHILASGEGEMYLARLNMQPMGLLYLLGETTHSARIEALLTVPDAWGKGVGASLISKAITDARAAGFSELHVWPFAENTRARRFYEKWGFSASGASRCSDAAELEYVLKLSSKE